MHIGLREQEVGQGDEADKEKAGTSEKGGNAERTAGETVNEIQNRKKRKEGYIFVVLKLCW